MRKFFSIILSFSLILSLTSLAFADNNQLQNNQFIELAEMQKPAIAAHETLYNSFISEGSFVEIYPSNYGGDYIDGSILHICIVDLPNQDITPYELILEQHLDNIVFENVDYSLQCLLDASDEIAYTLASNGITVVSTGINEPNNAVLVRVEPSNLRNSNLILQQYFDNKSPQNINTPLYEAKNVSFSVPTLFEEGKVMTPTVELMGGSTLQNYTAGVCGLYNGQPAIGMCGHGLSTNSSVYYQTNGVQSSQIGKVNTMRYENGRPGDYAIVRITNSDFTTSSKVGDPTLPSSQVQITGTISRAATGLAIIKYGKNGGYAYGNVSSSNSTWYPTGMTSGISGMVNVRLSMGSVVSGDSGGPVYTSSGQFCGTVSGTASSDDYGFSHFVFSPYTYLISAGFLALTN